MSRIFMVFDEMRSREEGRLVLKHQDEVGCAPAVYADTIDPTVCDADGKVYDSRSKMRAGAAAAGCVEVSASDLGRSRRSRDTEEYRRKVRDAAEKAYHDLRNDRIPRREVESVSVAVRRLMGE